MKIRLFYFSVVAASALALSAFTGEIKNEGNDKIADCKFGQCSFIKKDGYQCRNCAQENSYYCWSHRDK
jgi:hypothetical protein